MREDENGRPLKLWGAINEMGEVVIPVECSHIKFLRDTYGDQLSYCINGDLKYITYPEPKCDEYTNRRDAYGEVCAVAIPSNVGIED